MPISLKILRIFVAAAETGSTTLAASSLGLSQPSVSLAVAELEKVLGLQLFVRHHARGVSLTAAGTDVLREARKLIVQVNELEVMASALGNDLRGPLKIGCLPYLVPRYLPSIIAGFSKEHPDIELTFVEGDQELLIGALMSGDIKTALSYNIGLPNTIAAQPLHDLPPYLIVSEGHRFARQKRVKLAALADDPVILLDLPISRDYYSAIFSQKRITPNIRFRTTSVEAVRSLVANGLGYSILNHRPAIRQTYDGRKVVELDITEKLPSAQVVSIRPAGTKVRGAARAFVEHTLRYFQSL